MAKKTTTTATATPTPTESKAKATKKTTKAPSAPAIEAAPIPAPTPAPAPVNETVEAVDPEKTLTDDFVGFMGKLQAASSLFSNLRNEFRSLEKKCSRELKVARKVTKKQARKSGNRSPSGFVKPTLVTDELATFLGKPSGTEMARTEVTREINKYIRAHNLQNPQNGRHIIPDAALAKLLKLKKDDELTYFNLQRYMSPHFPKSAAAIAAAAVIAAAAAAAAEATASVSA
jgi:upstream activation factor subunit UAF30